MKDHQDIVYANLQRHLGQLQVDLERRRCQCCLHPPARPVRMRGMDQEREDYADPQPVVRPIPAWGFALLGLGLWALLILLYVIVPFL
jgi:hypothetical protein